MNAYLTKTPRDPLGNDLRLIVSHEEDRNLSEEQRASLKKLAWRFVVMDDGIHLDVPLV